MINPDQLLNGTIGLWWQNTPAYEGHQIGSFSPPSNHEELAAAETHLHAQGCTFAIAPMEGNAWRAHRAVVESDGSPPFLLEPITPPQTAHLLHHSGYQILARYSSSRIDLRTPSRDLSRLEKRLEDISIRSLKVEDLESELRAVYRLSTRAFADNFLYTPITESEFLAQYLPLRSHLTPNCAFLAESGDQLVGYVFGYPDQDRFIVKTLAVLPERRFAGLGTLLVDQMQRQASLNSFTTAIHALQREDNQSLRISRRFDATIFRRYALFGKPL